MISRILKHLLFKSRHCLQSTHTVPCVAINNKLDKSQRVMSTHCVGIVQILEFLTDHMHVHVLFVLIHEPDKISAAKTLLYYSLIK